MFIQKGTLIEVLKPVDVTALVHWTAPMTSDLRCSLSPALVLVVFGDSDEHKATFTCVPENPDTFAAEHIPEDIRRSPKFAGISLIIEKALIGRSIRVAS